MLHVSGTWLVECKVLTGVLGTPGRPSQGQQHLLIIFMSLFFSSACCGLGLLFFSFCLTTTQRSFHLFTPHVPATTRAGPGWSQELGTQSESPLWMAGTQGLTASLAAPQVYISRKLDWKRRSWGRGCQCGKERFNHCTKNPPLTLLLLGTSATHWGFRKWNEDWKAVSFWIG